MVINERDLNYSLVRTADKDAIRPGDIMNKLCYYGCATQIHRGQLYPVIEAMKSGLCASIDAFIKIQFERINMARLPWHENRTDRVMAASSRSNQFGAINHSRQRCTRKAVMKILNFNGQAYWRIAGARVHIFNTIVGHRVHCGCNTLSRHLQFSWRCRFIFRDSHFLLMETVHLFGAQGTKYITRWYGVWTIRWQQLSRTPFSATTNYNIIEKWNSMKRK